jgi:hypothetical protein
VLQRSPLHPLQFPAKATSRPSHLALLTLARMALADPHLLAQPASQVPRMVATVMTPWLAQTRWLMFSRRTLATGRLRAQKPLPRGQLPITSPPSKGRRGGLARAGPQKLSQRRNQALPKSVSTTTKDVVIERDMSHLGTT